MTSDDAQRTLARIDATWPPRSAPPVGEYSEWIRFLALFDFALGERALDALRSTLTWRPAMADFRRAYYAAAAAPAPDLPALPGASASTRDLADLYGTDHGSWAYCWKCDMAITLEERATDPHSRPGRGLHHANCPKSGTAPIMSVADRTARAEWLGRRGEGS